MARVYALLQPDETLLFARPRGNGWAIGADSIGVEARGRNLTVFLSGLDVSGLSAVIPARNENEARRAAPYAIEDDLAESVEASHVALAEPDKSRPDALRQINVVSNTRLEDVISTLQAHGLDEAECMAAHSLLPDGNVLYEAPGLVLGRLGERSFTLDAGFGRDVLISLSASHAEMSIHGQHVAEALGRQADSAGASSLEALLVQLATWAEQSGRGIRLRQGAFEARRKLELEGADRWKFAGLLAAVAALAWFGAMVLETRAMTARADQLDSLAQEFARVGWPELGGDVRQVLATTGGDAGLNDPFPGLLDVSAVLYDGLAQVEGSELRTLRYDRARRQLTASVAFESFADVDRLTTVLSESGLTARSGDSRQSGSRVIGDLTLEGGS
ncbi:MAG: type II secretion system protein GspL [Hyphomonadaceae bacterium]|nr:type II secretion system protein GspL [Hyphomonadaceae bacterium]